MKPVTWIRFFLLCVVIGQFRAVEARNVHFTPQEKTDTLINPPLIKGAEHILRFDKTVLNIGTLTEDDAPKMYRFTCTNVSGKDINLTRVRTTCGCAVADVRTGEISPGETRVVVLTYHPKNHPGTIDTDAFVFIRYSGRSVRRLPMEQRIIPMCRVLILRQQKQILRHMKITGGLLTGKWYFFQSPVYKMLDMLVWP